MGGEVLMKKPEQIICTSVKPRAADEPCWTVTENCTPDPVSAERLSFLTEWRTEGKAGRQEEEEERGGGAAEAGSQPRCSSSVDRVLSDACARPTVHGETAVSERGCLHKPTLPCLLSSIQQNTGWRGHQVMQQVHMCT